jgi:hypothetical protein
MFKHVVYSASLLLILIAVGGCAALERLLVDDMPPPAVSTPVGVVMPTSTPPQVLLQPDTTSTAVGGEIVIQIDVIALGLPVYTISLSPGAMISVPYSGDSPTVQTPEPAAAPFRIVSSAEEIASGTLRLLAVQPGDATLTIFVTGEGGLPAGPFYWTSVQPDPLVLTALA